MLSRISKLIFAGVCVWSAVNLPAAAPAVLFEGARLIVDARRPPIQNAAFLVDNGRILKVGTKGTIQPPAGAALRELISPAKLCSRH